MGKEAGQYGLEWLLLSTVGDAEDSYIEYAFFSAKNLEHLNLVG